MAELRAEDVAARLATLRALYVPESLEEARQRLERERPEPQETFDQAVARRLRELRAVCDLVHHVRGIATGPPGTPGAPGTPGPPGTPDTPGPPGRGTPGRG